MSRNIWKKTGRVICCLALVLALLLCIECGNARQRNSNFLYISHRGGEGPIPENTVEALADALGSGFGGVELDVWETDSGELLVFHDPTLERMCGSDKNIWEISTANRNMYPMKSGGKTYLIPTLEEVLDAVKDKDGAIYLHIKIDKTAKHYFSEDAAGQVIQMLREKNLVKNSVVFATHRKRVLGLFAGSGVNLGYITGQTERKVLEERMAWCVENNVQTLILYKMDGIKQRENGADLVNDCHEKGLSIGVYKVTNRNDEKFLIRTGADFSISMKAFFK